MLENHGVVGSGREKDYEIGTHQYRETQSATQGRIMPSNCILNISKKCSLSLGRVRNQGIENLEDNVLCLLSNTNTVPKFIKYVLSKDI